MFVSLKTCKNLFLRLYSRFVETSVMVFLHPKIPLLAVKCLHDENDYRHGMNLNPSLPYVAPESDQDIPFSFRQYYEAGNSAIARQETFLAQHIDLQVRIKIHDRYFEELKRPTSP